MLKYNRNLKKFFILILFMCFYSISFSASKIPKYIAKYGFNNVKLPNDMSTWVINTLKDYIKTIEETEIKNKKRVRINWNKKFVLQNGQKGYIIYTRENDNYELDKLIEPLFTGPEIIIIIPSIANNNVFFLSAYNIEYERKKQMLIMMKKQQQEQANQRQRENARLQQEITTRTITEENQRREINRTMISNQNNHYIEPNRNIYSNQNTNPNVSLINPSNAFGLFNNGGK